MATTEVQLSDLFSKLASLQGNEDIEKGYQAVAQHLKEIKQCREEWVHMKALFYYVYGLVT